MGSSREDERGKRGLIRYRDSESFLHVLVWPLECQGVVIVVHIEFQTFLF